MELTRKRTREPAHMLCEPCPTRGPRPETARSVCYDILREILARRQFNPKEFRIVASAAVVECSSTRRACTWRA